MHAAADPADAPRRQRAHRSLTLPFLRSVFLAIAVKFTPPGGAVALLATRAGTAIELAIADTGIGCDPAQRDALFSPVTQLSADLGRSHGGLGLGLALARRLAAAQGGSLRAESAGAGTGSVFTLALPAVERAS